MSAEKAAHETFGGGGYYAYDEPTLTRADLHGCLDEDVNTGDPLVCRECAFPPANTDGGA